MAMDFPDSPTNGQTYLAPSGLTYVYQSGIGWTLNMFRYTSVQCNFTALASQQTFNVPGGYAPGLVQVYKNGAKLINGVTVTVTSGTAVVTATPCSAGDTIEVVGLSAFSLSAGYLVGNQYIYLTSSSGTYTPSNGCRAVIVEAEGAGASSGGTAATGVGEGAVSGGGGAGGYSQKLITSLLASYAYTVGAGGAAPSAGANNGNDGGQTTFGSVLTANGGIKGLSGANGSGFQMTVPAIGGTASGGDLNLSGGRARRATCQSGNIFCLPDGGVSHITPGHGVCPDINTVGSTPSGYGTGAPGVAVGASQTAKAGVAGANGVIRILELF